MPLIFDNWCNSPTGNISFKINRVAGGIIGFIKMQVGFFNNMSIY